ncbi:MAG: hypothetical protein KDI30_06090 [Pseudomonadales bacterium]|nr:hypothetical protein [Pseudomonadales bacterium]
MSKSTKLIPYVEAFGILAAKLDTSKEEFAGWIFLGPKDGGLDAYQNASQLEPDAPKPPRFYFSYHEGERDYLQLLPQLWFVYEDILNFNPSNEARLLTFESLLSRWDQIPGTTAVDFIKAKIADSSLMDLHPTFGGTQALNPAEADFPPLEEGLFSLAEIILVEEKELKNLIAVAPKSENFTNKRLGESSLSINSGSVTELPNPPKRMDDWYLAIRDARHEFITQNMREPDTLEMWLRLCQMPPSSYGITIDNSFRETTLHLDNKPLTKTNFKLRWNRYSNKQVLIDINSDNKDQ